MVELCCCLWHICNAQGWCYLKVVPKDGVIWRRSRGDEHQRDIQEGEVEKTSGSSPIPGLFSRRLGILSKNYFRQKLSENKKNQPTNQPTNLPTYLPTNLPTACSTNQLLPEILSQRAKGSQCKPTRQSKRSICLHLGKREGYVLLETGGFWTVFLGFGRRG